MFLLYYKSIISWINIVSFFYFKLCQIIVIFLQHASPHDFQFAMWNIVKNLFHTQNTWFSSVSYFAINKNLWGKKKQTNKQTKTKIQTKKINKQI